ncbi:MAG: CHAT domain-containing protein [Candidatus Polarisedimenticolia bacterium]
MTPADRPGWRSAALAVVLLIASTATSRLGGSAGLRPGVFQSGGSPPDAARIEATWWEARARADQAASGPQKGTLAEAEAIDDLMKAVSLDPRPERLREAISRAGAAIALKEKLLSTDDHRLADTLAHQANVLTLAEDYGSALVQAERALAIRRLRAGARAPITGSSCYQVAEILRLEGNYAAAIALHEEALSIWRDHPDFDPAGIAASLDYLGVMHGILGDLDKASGYLQASITQRQRTAGQDSPQVAMSLDRLGSLALRRGRPLDAMRHLDRAQAIREARFGPRDPRIALSLEKLAGVLEATGSPRAARIRLERALDIRTRAFGPDHPLVARSLARLARLDTREGAWEKAERGFRLALAIQQADPRTGLRERADTLAQYALLAWAREDLAGAIDVALQAERTARQGFVATAQRLSDMDAVRYERSRTTGLDVALTALVSSRGGAALPSSVTSEVWDELIRSRALVLDTMVSRQRSGVPDTAAVGLKEVTASLPENAALVSYVRYSHLALKGAPDEPRYLALVLRDGRAAPTVVELSTADALDAAIHAWRTEAGKDPRTGPPAESEPRYRKAGERLRELLWDPVEPMIKDRHLVLLVPDAAVGLVAFDSLPGAEGGYLIEDGQRRQCLSAERSLTREKGTPREESVLVMGGADFDAPDTGDPGGGGLPAPACRAFASRRFEPLPGTRREARHVEALWRGRADVTVLEGRGATEASFRKKAPGSTLLHIATHGFFLQESCPSSFDALQDNEDVPPADPPLRLSGLALAGANRRRAAASGQDDGLLTAEEIAMIDLEGVDWAVLSGCETGTGEIVGGEGLLGLRRALEIAGARTAIMSLWAVDDGAAGIWMKHLHEGRIAGLSTVDAVRQAGLRMIQAHRERGAATHPFFWGAFVASGDWR